MIVALGDLMLDITCRADAPVLDGTHRFVQARFSAGGSAANFAVWAARLGAEVGLISRVGQDIVGRALLMDLRDEGVQLGVATGTEATGFTMLVTEPGDRRSMLAARGATAALSVDDLDWGMLDRADLLHVTAYSFFEQGPRKAALAAMKRVKDRGGLLSLDPSAHGFLQRTGARAFFALSTGVDLFFPNLEEGRTLTGERDPERVVRRLLEIFPVAALKLGPQGAFAGRGGEIVHHAGFPVEVMDTTGAGDAFAAAFIVSWLKDHDLAAALAAGNRVAAGVVQAAGARATAAPPSV